MKYIVGVEVEADDIAQAHKKAFDMFYFGEFDKLIVRPSEGTPIE